MMSGLVLALDGATVDRVIETMRNDARYFAGLVVWRPGSSTKRSAPARGKCGRPTRGRCSTLIPRDSGGISTAPKKAWGVR